MNPGRELDSIVAKRVMGWKHVDQEDGPNGEPSCIDHDQIERHFAEVPHYSTQIADAWQVVEKLTEGGDRSFTLNRCCDYPVIPGHEQKQAYIAHFSHGTSKLAETAPHAICLAALKAVGAL